MEGFTKIPKMQCFKEGGAVQKQVKDFTRRDRKTVDTADVAQDKKIVKKAFSMHDTQQHEEKTDLAGLKKGGRAKKEKGTVKKYAAGGSIGKIASGLAPAAFMGAAVAPAVYSDLKSKEKSADTKSADAKSAASKKCGGKISKYKVGGTVENQYAAKKTDKDIKDIANTKRQKPVKLCGGGKMGKYAEGGSIQGTVSDAARKLKENIIGTPEQNKAGQAALDKQAAAGSKLAKVLGGQGAISDAERTAASKFKKGGSAKK